MGLLVGHSDRVLLGLVQLKHLGILGQLAGVFLGHLVGVLLGLVQLEPPGLLRQFGRCHLGLELWGVISVGLA